MEFWEIIIAIYGLAISPFAGIKLVKFRLDTQLKAFRDLMVYLLAGMFNVGVTVYSLTLLPEGSWLAYWGMLIIFFYIAVYGAANYTVPM